MKDFCPNAPSWTVQAEVPLLLRTASGAASAFLPSAPTSSAPGEFVLGDRFSGELRKKADAAAARGPARFGSSPTAKRRLAGKTPRPCRRDIAPIAMGADQRQKSAKSARETLQYFADQGVDLKVISGDNAITVANIAKNSRSRTRRPLVDATTLHSEEDIAEAVQKFSVFGPCDAAAEAAESSRP